MTVTCITCTHFTLRDPRVAAGGPDLARSVATMRSMGMGNCSEYPVWTFLAPAWTRDCEWHRPVSEADMAARDAWLAKI